MPIETSLLPEAMHAINIVSNDEAEESLIRILITCSKLSIRKHQL